MKFIWFQDLNFLASPKGGAQMTDYQHYVYGLKIGLEQKLVTPEILVGQEIEQDDVLILSNITQFNPEMLATLDNPIIVFNHDYNFCKWRTFFPMADKCKNCYYKPAWEKLYKKAKLNIFLSPLHYDMYKFVFGDIKHSVIPSPVDPREFHNLGYERKKDIVTVNGHLKFKGGKNLEKFITENPGRRVDIIGENIDIPPSARYIGKVKNSALNEVLNEYKYYIELPDTPQPFNRTMAEASLAGCELITNGLSGFASFNWKKEEVKSNLGENSSKKFWDEVRGVI